MAIGALVRVLTLLKIVTDSVVAFNVESEALVRPGETLTAHLEVDPLGYFQSWMMTATKVPAI